MITKPAPALIAALAVVLTFATCAWTATMSGTLSNFDVFNDTGQECHGFEIELDGLSSKDITYEFSSPYIRYSAPRLIDFPGGVYVRYESHWDGTKFTETTPIPAAVTATGGHECWTGGSPNYATRGCEHFGIGMARNPTNVTYRWLVADPSKPGNLIASGTKVSLPAPTWNVVPPPPQNPVQAPVVQAFVQPEPPEVEGQYGNAKWAKVYVHQIQDKPDLHHLVPDDPMVPGESEVETEWIILQFNPNGAEKGELQNEDSLNAGNESVVRVYEFWEYTGAYDPETHEALPLDPPGSPGDVGKFLGRQNVAPIISPATQFQSRITTSGFLYSRVTKNYVGLVTVRNTSGADVKGPVTVQFAGLPAGVSLVNQKGTFQGSPYLLLPGADTDTKKFVNNQVTSFYVQFTATAPINFSANTFSGSLE